MTEFLTGDENRITIDDIEKPIERLLHLTQAHFTNPQIKAFVRHLQARSDFQYGDAQNQIEAAYYENQDWVVRILEVANEMDFEEQVLRECRAMSLGDVRRTWGQLKDTKVADLIAGVIREKVAEEKGEREAEDARNGQSQPVHFKEAYPCILSVNETDPYPCKLSAPENKMHGVLEGNSYYWDEETDEVLNTPCIEARLGACNATGVNVPSEQQGQSEQSKSNGAGATPDQTIQQGQQTSIMGKGAGRARKRRTHKPIEHRHLKMVADYRSYGLREIHLQLWHNAPNSGQALFTGKLEYKALRGDETRFQYCDFQTQRKFRGTLNKPMTRPGPYTKGKSKRFIDEPWYKELNQYLLHQNQIREEHGLPELLVSHSQHTQRSRKGNIVWVHREDKRVLLLFRGTKVRPQKVQMIDGRFVLDFPVLNPDISVEDGSPDWRGTWYRE